MPGVLDKFMNQNASTGSQPGSKENVLTRLLGKKDIDITTRTPKVLQMAAVEAHAFYFSSEDDQLKMMKSIAPEIGISANRYETKQNVDAGDLMNFVIYRLKIDAISFQGKRVEEILTPLRSMPSASETEAAVIERHFK